MAGRFQDGRRQMCGKPIRHSLPFAFTTLGLQLPVQRRRLSPDPPMVIPGVARFGLGVSFSVQDAA